MSALSEAAVLLRSGTQFSRRIGYPRANGELVFAGVRRGAFSIYIEESPFFHFDLEGRWQRVYIDSAHFRKALDGSIVRLDRIRSERNMILHRHHLSTPEALALDERIRNHALQIRHEILDPATRFVELPNLIQPLSQTECTKLLDRIIAWDASAWNKQFEQYRQTYSGEIGVLPPDAVQSLALQATLPKSPESTEPNPAVRSLADFQQHLERVRALQGRRILQATGLFLGGGDVTRILDLPAYLEAATRAFPLAQTELRPRTLRELPENEPHLTRFDLLIEDLRPPHPDCAAWKAISAAGVTRVSVLLGSTDPSLRHQLGFQGEPEFALEIIRQLKAARLATGLIIWTGLANAVPLVELCELVNELPLDRSDLIFLIDLEDQARHLDRPLDSDLMCAPHAPDQSSLARDWLKPIREKTGAKVVLYQLDKQWN
jgi:hypothetical protein